MSTQAFIDIAIPVVVGGFFWVLIILIWPFKPCKACRGGRRYSPFGTFWRNCPTCGGSGKHLRIVARLLRRRP